MRCSVLCVDLRCVYPCFGFHLHAGSDADQPTDNEPIQGNDVKFINTLGQRPSFQRNRPPSLAASLATAYRTFKGERSPLRCLSELHIQWFHKEDKGGRDARSAHLEGGEQREKVFGT